MKMTRLQQAIFIHCLRIFLFGILLPPDSYNIVFSKPATLDLYQVYNEVNTSKYDDDVEKALIFLKDFDREANSLQVKSGEANWEYETDLTNEHLNRVIEIGENVSNFYLNNSIKTRSIKSLDLPNNLTRQIRLITRTVSPLEKELRTEIATLVGNMTKIFGSTVVKRESENSTIANLTSTDIRDIFTKSQNLTELNWAWIGWRDGVGPRTRPLFASLVDYLNIGAREHGWLDYGRFLRSDYEMSDMLEESLDEVWTEIEPLYKELHAYVRFKLSKKYGISNEGCIPASLLGDLYAQDWEAIFELVKPVENSKAFDVTSQLKAQNYTVKGMFELAESFFTSIGLDAMPKTFWNRSVIVKSKDKEMVCHPSAWDVSRNDVRIKMCAHVNQKDLTTIHHEMGHIEYFLAYRNQPTIFRAGANPGFHEAIGDTISLSVESPSYLHEVGLLDSPHMDKDDEISFLLNQALRRISPIPYNLLVDKWRWRIYEGVVTEEVYNKAWWEHRIKYQGVEPPVMRPADSFDAASKYHIGSNVPYVPYFISYVLQFQLHQKLCSLAGHTGPLHACSIFNSTKAGTELRKLLSAGRSQPWPLILQSFSGQRTLKADAILQYFAPLKEWLMEKRKKEGYKIGWKMESSVPILQAQLQKPESGKERSSIFKAANPNPNPNPNQPNSMNNNNNNNNNNIENTKADDDKTTLSFNIPPDTLKNLLNNYPEVKQQYEGSKASNASSAVTQGMTENATNPSDSQMAMGNIDTPAIPLQSSNPDSNLNHNGLYSSSPNTAATSPPSDTPMSISELSKLLATKKLSKPVENDANSPSADHTSSSSNKDTKDQNTAQPGAAVESTPVVNADEAMPPGTNQTASVDKTAILSTIKNLLSNNVSLYENQVTSHGSSNTGAGLTDANEKIQNNVNKGPDGINSDHKASPSTNNNPSVNQIESMPAASVSPQMLSSLQGTTAQNNTTAAVSPTEPPPLTANNASSAAPPQPVSGSSPSSSSLVNEALVNPEGKQGNVNNANNAKILEQASSLSKDDLLKVLKDALASKQTASNAPATNSIDSVNKESDQSNSPPKASLEADQQSSHQTPPTNEDIANGLKKLLGMNDPDKINTTTFAKDGSKFTKLIETCVRSTDDPKCLHGKITTEGGYVPKAKNGVDDSKQTISISPSSLVQKLMERKKAEESAPDAVVNALPTFAANTPLITPDVGTSTTENDPSSKKTVPVDSKALMSLLQAAIKGGGASKDATTSTRQDVANATNYREGGNKTLCNKLMKRGFSIKYNCDGLLSNFSHVGLTGKAPVSTTDLLRTLITNSGGGEIVNKNTSSSVSTSSSAALPPTHLQKTSSGFQVDFDLNVKDQIPKEQAVVSHVSGTLKTLASGRQQHIDLYNTPKGVAVKPKSSVQLLKPQFVPVAQSRDHVELKEKKSL